jgi:hypothetical protein
MSNEIEGKEGDERVLAALCLGPGMCHVELSISNQIKSFLSNNLIR